jgi:hypothetical protein
MVVAGDTAIKLFASQALVTSASKAARLSLALCACPRQPEQWWLPRQCAPLVNQGFATANVAYRLAPASNFRRARRMSDARSLGD